MITIDTTNMCSHLQKKLFEENGIYHSLWIAMQDDPELTAVVRSRQLHIYRNGKKVLVLAGKSVPKIIREDSICELLQEVVLNYRMMKLKKRKIKYSAIFFLCWFALLVLLVDGVLKFQTLVDYFGSYALVEVALLLLVLLPTLAVYAFTKEKK